MWIGFP